MTRFLILLLSMKFKKTGIILVSCFLTMFIFCNTTMVQVLLKVGYWKYEKWEYCEGPCQFFSITSDVSEICDDEFSI